MELEEKGFLKTAKPEISPETKSELIRKGNKAFNNNDIELAKRIFITTNYSDGLSRVGDFYYKKGVFIEAMKMYILAHDEYKKSWMFKNAADLIRYWMKEDENGSKSG